MPEDYECSMSAGMQDGISHPGSLPIGDNP